MPLTLINRLGNKTNDIKYFSDFFPNMNSFDTVVEPFGGSFAISVYFFNKGIKKFHINDNDKQLYYLYNNPFLYKEETNKFLEHAKENKEKMKANEILDTFLFSSKEMKEMIKNNFIIRGNFFKHPKTRIEDSDIHIKILTNPYTIISCCDYKCILDKYYNEEKAFVFIDPPYLFQDNSGYMKQRENNDISEYIIEILKFMDECYCKCMLVINKMNLINYLLQSYYKKLNIVCEYTKVYQMSRKKNIHYVITNY
jgi:site-specific DNA-adenine methylase